MQLYLILLGLPGAGKGTQTHRLGEAFGLTRIATGDILRRIAQESHALGQRVRAILEAGQLVDDATVFEVVQHYLDAARGQTPGVILDGFPRNVAQAELLDGYLQKWGERERCWAVYLDVPETVVQARLSARRICPKCERVYNLISRPSARGDRCEVCHTPLIQRKDDHPEVIRERLHVYYRQTEPLLAFYRDRERLVTVHADQSEDAVFTCIARYVRLWLTQSPSST